MSELVKKKALRVLRAVVNEAFENPAATEEICARHFDAFYTTVAKDFVEGELDTLQAEHAALLEDNKALRAQNVSLRAQRDLANATKSR